MVSIGKGLSAGIARKGALMESCEAWHAERRVVVAAPGTWADVSRTHRSVDPLDLPSAIGRRPRPDEVFDWTTATDLLTGDDWLLPSAYVSLDFRVGVHEDVRVARSSNGLSAGASDAHALRHGLLEVLERAAEDTWRTSNDSRRVDLDTVPHDRRVDDLLGRIRNAGLYLAAWDVTDRTGVPCFAAAVWQEVTSERPVRTMREVRIGAAHAAPAQQFTELLRVIQAAGSGPVLAVDLTDSLLGLAVWKVVVPGAPGPYGIADLPARIHPLWRGVQ